ncbi:MAG: hypothetical protein PWP28_2737 [Oceanotoga sp.]|jgi:hypothetical protein|nr:hypothetical protein [Oceanotoga sp.]
MRRKNGCYKRKMDRSKKCKKYYSGYVSGFHILVCEFIFGTPLGLFYESFII